MTILLILATAFGTSMALSNFIQAHKIFKRKIAKDIAITTHQNKKRKSNILGNRHPRTIIP